MKHTDQKTLSLGALALSALLLVGCADNSGGGEGAEETAAPAETVAPAETTTSDATDGPTEDASASPSGTASGSASPSGTASGSASPSGAAGGDAAVVATAVAGLQQEFPDGQLFEIDRKDGDEGWEVKFAVDDREQEAEVSADGSEITPQDGDDPLDQDDREKLAQVQVPLQDAVQTALEEVDGRLDDAQLGTEDGITVWEVDIDDTDGASVDVYVNVENGSVLKVDR